MKKVIIFTIFFIVYSCLNAQNKIEGKVLELSEDGYSSPIFGANVYWEGTNVGSVTDTNGNYSIDEAISFPATLSVSYVGYTPYDQEIIDGRYIFYLKNIVELNAVQVTSNLDTRKMSVINPINTQVLSTGELQKAACCNLSESFETNISVDVVHTDAISGLKKIQMLGLDGSYVQITNETMPLIRGLQRSYGLTYVPGSWIESVQIIRGMGSVVNGYESFTGQINAEYFRPFNADRMFWNLYTNSAGKIENNLLLCDNIGDWQSNLFTHISYFDKEIDNDGDGFINMPRAKQFSFLNRLQYLGSPNYRAQINVKGLLENRISGQKEGVDNRYIADIDNSILNIYGKIGTLNHSGKSIALQTSLLVHKQSVNSGNNYYKGIQESAFANLIFENKFNDSHDLRYGISYYADRYTENFAGNTSFPYDRIRTDLISGLYIESNFSSSEVFKIISGIRVDYYNVTGNFYYSPRLNLRYNPSERTVLRASLGKAFRVSQPLIENMNYLNSLRYISIDADILPEEAINYGINAVHCFYLFSREGTISLDIYRTQFINQVIVDIEDQKELLLYNLEGKSFANNIQIEFDYELISRLNMRVGYKINNTISNFRGESKEVPLIPKYRSLFNLSYTNKSNKWLFDFTANYIGSTRIPEHDEVDIEYSDQFSLFNCNITRRLDHFDIYIGGENMLNYRQDNPVLGSDDWSNSNFDASLIYAPVHGRNIYLGIRYNLE